MDQNENTKSEPKQDQSPGPQDSASQAEEPGNMKAESPRKCNICGGPNHYGCGCEAKAMREVNFEAPAPAAGQPETEAPADHGTLTLSTGQVAGQPESEALAAETQTQAEKKAAFNKVIEGILNQCSPDDVKKILEGELDFAKDIKMMADGFEGLCACLYDTNNYLKIIAGDLITIRKILSKEDEVKDAGLIETKDNLSDVISYLSNIDKHLKDLLNISQESAEAQEMEDAAENKD